VPKQLKVICILSLFAALCGCDPEMGGGDEDAGQTEAGQDGAVAVHCDGVSDTCPCASAESGARRYLFCLDVATWQQANDRCRALGYELVKIQDPNEMDFVFTQGSEVAGGPNDWWIGLRDVDAEGSFVWSDGTPLGDFAPWAPLQPDQGGAEVTLEEDCIESHGMDGGGWNDLECDIGYLDFICEGDL
jgi:low affinity immunoglobulin epsilon Fc receptor